MPGPSSEQIEASRFLISSSILLTGKMEVDQATAITVVSSGVVRGPEHC